MVALLQLQALETITLTALRTRWGSIKASVQAGQAVAVKGTNGAPELVVLDAKSYDDMQKLAERGRSAEDMILSGLRAKFDAQLASLNQPDARAKVDAVMNAKEWLAPAAPKAGVSF